MGASDADRPAVEGWLKGLRQAIADSKQKELVIFIHGYKNSFEDCVKSAAQLVVDTDDAADDDSDTREPRAALVFDWASCDALQQYGMDLIRARRASSKLARLLVDVGNVVSHCSVCGARHSLSFLLTAAAWQEACTFDPNVSVIVCLALWKSASTACCVD